MTERAMPKKKRSKKKQTSKKKSKKKAVYNSKKIYQQKKRKLEKNDFMAMDTNKRSTKKKEFKQQSNSLQQPNQRNLVTFLNYRKKKRTYISVLANPHCLQPRYSQPDSNRWISLRGGQRQQSNPNGKKKRKTKNSPEFLCPCNIHCTIALLESQNWTPRSLDPDTTHAPSCETATDKTKS